MCGICGYITDKEIKIEELSYMNDSMYHRGPDDDGIWQFRMGDKEIGMAHRRLSILDLSELGHQPMLSHNGRYVISYNGEVYNYRELRVELEKEGHIFQSDCDTEVIVEAYDCWKTECFNRFNGMFAIAIYDTEEDELILARDRMGKKPLYYYNKGNDFVFASELKPIMRYPYFNKSIDVDAIPEYMCNKYLAAPRTIFMNTYKLVPGAFLKYREGKINVTRYWNIIEKYNSRKEISLGTDKETERELKRILDGDLNQSVVQRMISDVPLGTFLSGGIDSALITAIAQRNSYRAINSYTIGFNDNDRNEAPYAREIAKYLGTVHHEHYVSEEDILSMVEDLAVWYDEPFSDSSQLPSMLVSKFAREEITVALSGDGGDELFCGYKMYDYEWIAQHTDSLGGLAYRIPGIKQLLEASGPPIKAFIENRDAIYKSQLFADAMKYVAASVMVFDVDNIKYDHEKEIIEDTKETNWQIRRMLLDMQTYLPDEVLCKMDRASMKYSLEVRCPILDYKVVEDSFHIPHTFKYRNFNKKYILKQLAYDYIPKELLNRPKKGFGVPLRRWLRTVLADEISKYSERNVLIKQGIFNPDGIRRLIDVQKKSDMIMYSTVLWSFYVFQKWYQMYIEDLW